jgi:REP element-mobilizing transposase RayT
MPLGLKRYQHEGDDHFITFSCYRREPYFIPAASKDIFLDSLELARQRYNFEVLGYVVMPEHVHLLVSEPADHETPLSKALQSLKLSDTFRTMSCRTGSLRGRRSLRDVCTGLAGSGAWVLPLVGITAGVHLHGMALMCDPLNR